MIKVHKAFHGIAVNDRSTLDAEEECSVSPGKKDKPVVQKTHGVFKSFRGIA